MDDLSVGPLEVKLVRWPIDTERRNRYRAAGVPRLLVVEAGARPPVSSDLCEDWVRAPVSRDDLRARIAALKAKAESMRAPQVDPSGVLRCGLRSVSLSPAETDLLTVLVDCFGELASKELLGSCLTDRSEHSRRNALHLHISRIRRRIQPLGLAIRTVWGRGYLLESGPGEKNADGSITGGPYGDRIVTLEAG